MVLVDETLGVDFVDVFRSRWTRRKPAVLCVTTLSPPMGAPLPGACVSMCLNFVAGELAGIALVAVTACLNAERWASVAGMSIRS